MNMNNNNPNKNDTDYEKKGKLNSQFKKSNKLKVKKKH